MTPYSGMVAAAVPKIGPSTELVNHGGLLELGCWTHGFEASVESRVKMAGTLVLP